ncbi:MAG: ABC transporter permease subunit [Gemmatimonadetes bacterium]|jgi:ABC-type transport system involved in multi-copper enzyme maturation permease subunit|nr:ABC transporter permease subunit [Gemmatimonadota bacterium]MBT4610907.1 ABC transporter permease subunit [Gemmatimonadota bacterium]MBT5056477.1 ABC transporter permease subunit [Gemmatimonadota bacterium]MBT5144454.1 ABC transporter permease subunit [Gemmatimonadota bacterium]MBT5587028.1 ABC transporter permease subunit [Gemmatimonadota bacterium]
MLLHIVRKELLDQLRSLRFAIACAVCLLVMLLSCVVLTRDYGEALSTYNMNRVMHRNELEQRTQIWSVNEGMTVDRPLNLMNTMVRGLSQELTESVKIQPGNRLDFPESWDGNPVLPLFPAVDFVFIVGVIVSLLALAFGYDAVSGEAESGVLKLLLSYSVPRDLVLLGKWIGGYLALIAPFTVSFLLALLLMLLFPEVEPDLDSSLSLLALFCLALLYLAAIFSLGLFISSRTRLASTSITVLLLLWVAFVLALPNMAPYAVSQIVPIPSQESVRREKAAIQQDWSERFQTIWREEQEKQGRDDVYDDALRQRFDDMRLEMEAEVQKISDNQTAQVRHQMRWSAIIARISPMTSFTLASLDLAAAGITQEERYVDALQAFSEKWGVYAEEKQVDFRRVMEENRGRMTQELMEQFNNVDLSDAPQFQFSHMPVEDRLTLVYPDLLLLVLWNVIFFMGAWLSFVRYDVQ